MMQKAQDKPGQADHSLKFFDWAYANGDKMAADLEYVALPDAVKALVTQAMGRDQGRRRQGDFRTSNPHRARSLAEPSQARAVARPFWSRRGRYTCPHRHTIRTRWNGPTRWGGRPARRRAAPWADTLFSLLAHSAAILTLLMLAGIIVSLIVGASPAIREYGLSFLWRSEWDPVKNQYGGLVMIYGTLMTSLIALVIAVPVSFGIALFLTELSPGWLRRPLGVAIELLAAVPSIVYGMWGPAGVQPGAVAVCAAADAAAVGNVPFLKSLVSGAPVGIGILSAGHHPRDHDHSVHRRGDARRVRSDAGDAEGIGLWAWARRPGRSCSRWCFRTPRRASSAASCWAWVAHWVKRWP
jgi:hypothetical protein